MSKIKIEDIKKECLDLNWALLSESYKNLNEDMIFKCPKGHEVNLTYGKWRKYHLCPACEYTPIVENDLKYIKKNKVKKRILALDAATYITGFSIYDDDELIYYGTFETKSSAAEERVNKLKCWLISTIAKWQPDLIGIEDIQLQQKGDRNGDNIEGVTTYKALAKMQGVLLDVCYESKVEILLVFPSVWREYWGVKGKYRTEKKRSAQLIIKNKYNINVSDDVADAICLGRYCVSKQKSRVEMIKW